MLLYEFTGADPLVVGLIAVIGQLKSSIDAGTEKEDWTVDELLQYLKNNNVIIDKDNLFDMVKVAPLNRSIDNIQGDSVIFKGQESEISDNNENEPDKQKAIVKSMAQRAAK